MKPKQKIEPRGKYLLIKPDSPSAQENQFGLLMPANEEREQKAMGEVLGVGSEVKDIKKGDRVVFGMFSGESIKLRESTKEVDYKLVHEEDVVAFLR